MDQAAVLRIMKETDKGVHAMASKIEHEEDIASEKKKENTRVIAITSGKGVLGKHT